MGMIRGCTMTENLVTDIKLLKHLSGMPVVELPAAPRRAVCCAGPIAGHRQLDSLANRWGVEPPASCLGQGSLSADSSQTSTRMNSFVIDQLGYNLGYLCLQSRVCRNSSGYSWPCEG